VLAGQLCDDRRNLHSHAARSGNAHAPPVIRALGGPTTLGIAQAAARLKPATAPLNTEYALRAHDARAGLRPRTNNWRHTMKIKHVLAITAVVLTLGAPALAQMKGMDMQKMMEMMTPKSDDPQSTKDFKQLHMDMMRNMNMDFSGNPDADFARSMMKHHQGGIDMAKIQLKHGKDPEMRKMAEKLIKEQGDDHKKFDAWLKKQPKR
jgi:hypothetical protein